MPDHWEEISRFAARHRLPPDGESELYDLLATLIGAATSAAEGAASETVYVDGEREPAAVATPAEVSRSAAERYEDLGVIGVGGMGEVRRVRDRELDRTLAMKVIRGELSTRRSVVARFLDEARVGAQLQHPGVPPVHELGRLPDGGMYFTMKEIKGRSFARQIREAHRQADGLGEVALRRLCDTFAKVCDAVAYAHSRGVLHRDLKPENVMVGDFGEVLVIDWGLAKVLGRPGELVDPDPIRSARESGPLETRVGQVMGTAAYMAPEQARGETLDARADVYALGAMLYELLAGRAPYDGPDAFAVLARVLAGPPEDVRRAADRPLPEELVASCRRTMARSPSDRPPDASSVAAEVRSWLDGARRRESALAVVASASEQAPAAAALTARASRLREEARALLAGVLPWEDEERKAPAWALEDEAVRLERQAALGELKREALLRGALTQAPDLPEAHAGLVEIELARHAAAEAARDPGLVAQAEARLVEHLGAMSGGHPWAARAAAYLKGDGAVTLATDPPGAEVELFRYERHRRRLVGVPVRPLGVTPLVRVALPMGSYLCVLRRPGHAEVRYPVHIGRGEHWDGVAPGERDPRPVRLPTAGELGPDDVHVAEGWYWSGGHADAIDGLPRRRLWCEAFVLKRFPVTNREYLEFLNDLVRTGREADALALAPREEAGNTGTDGALMYARDPDGQFSLPKDTTIPWDEEWPAVMVHWGCANAYAAWLSERTGAAWRLPSELEWEKAARGVDGRFFPWGDVHDPSWCHMRDSHAEARRLPAVVDSRPVDVSVYGVRGLGGNVQDWCAERFSKAGPGVPEGRVVVPRADADADDLAVRHVVKGGSWSAVARSSSGASRLGLESVPRLPIVGIRVARSVGEARGDPDQ